MPAKPAPIAPFAGLLMALRLQLRDPVFRAAFAILATVMLTGMVFYMLVEGWSPLDAIYFCVVTSATVGFGDLTPTTDLGKAFTIFYIFVSVGMLVLVLSRLAGGMVQLRLERVGSDPQQAADELGPPVAVPPGGQADQGQAGAPVGRPADTAVDAPPTDRPVAPADTPPAR